MPQFVMDTMVPKSYTITAPDLHIAGSVAKGLLNKGETLLTVKALDVWEKDEIAKARGESPDAKPK